MSKPFRISYVVEGRIDCIVIDALVDAFLGNTDYVPTQIQPQRSDYAGDQGPLGGGWKGVLKWCQQAGASPDGFADSLEMKNCDCLIIHVDADIASDSELTPFDLNAPCPPAQTVCDRIHAHIAGLIGVPLPSNVALCVPAQSTETWVVAALHPDLAAAFMPIECRPDPATLLVGKRDKLVREKDGRMRKDVRAFEDAAPRIAKAWPNATAACPEANRFDQDCRAALPPKVV